MRDHLNEMLMTSALHPVSVSDNTEQNGVVIDRQDYDSLTFCWGVGAIADANATFTPKLEESDTGAFGGEENDVADVDILPVGTGQEAAQVITGTAEQNQSKKIGYIGTKRYVRFSIVIAGNTAAALMDAKAILGFAKKTPVA